MSDLVSTKTQSEIKQLYCRFNIYQTMAVLLRHPHLITECFSVRKEGHFLREAIETIDLPNKNQLKEALELLLEELNKTNFEQWRKEYENCFGHTAHGPVPSYELEYGEEHTHRQPQQLGDISSFYNAFGLKISKKVHERVDHVAVECEFMQFLLYKEAFALHKDGENKARICREASYKFLSEHLGCWVPSFARKLAKYSRQGLMNKIAEFVFAFVVRDCQQLGIPPGPNDLSIRMVDEKEDSGCVTCSLKAGFQC